MFKEILWSIASFLLAGDQLQMARVCKVTNSAIREHETRINSLDVGSPEYTAFLLLQTAKSKRAKRFLKDRVEAARFENSVSTNASILCPQPLNLNTHQLPAVTIV
jgi:hypothetical protein